MRCNINNVFSIWVWNTTNIIRFMSKPVTGYTSDTEYDYILMVRRLFFFFLINKNVWSILLSKSITSFTKQIIMFTRSFLSQLSRKSYWFSYYKAMKKKKNCDSCYLILDDLSSNRTMEETKYLHILHILVWKLRNEREDRWMDLSNSSNSNNITE